MSRYRSSLLALPLAAALLADALGAGAQQAPAPPGMPAPPSAPGGNAPTFPTAPPLPGGVPAPGPPPSTGGGGGIPTFPGGSPMPMALPPPPPPPPPAPTNMLPPRIPSGGFRPGFQPFPEMPMPGAMPQTPARPADTTSPPAAPHGVMLRYKFTPGQTVRYQITMDLNGSLKMGTSGTSTPMIQHLTMTLSQTVQSVSQDVATISDRISDTSVSLNGKNVPLPPQAQQPITLKMNTRGQVLSVQTVGGGATLPGMGQISPTQLEQMQALPVQAVSVGSPPWRADSVSPATGIESHAKYTLTDLSTNGSMATIAQKLWLQFKPAKASAQGPPLKMNGLMTGTGTQTFDVTAGQVASQTNHLHLVLTVTPPGNPNPVKTDFQITMTMQRQGNAPGTSVPPAAQPAPPTAPPPMGTEPPTDQLQ